VSPNPADADRDKVDALLAKIANMRASAFVESAPKTAQPALEVHVKFDDGKKEERVSFVKGRRRRLRASPGRARRGEDGRGRSHGCAEVAGRTIEVIRPAGLPAFALLRFGASAMARWRASARGGGKACAASVSATIVVACTLVACHPALPGPSSPSCPSSRSRLVHDIDARAAAPALEHGYWGC